MPPERLTSLADRRALRHRSPALLGDQLVFAKELADGSGFSTPRRTSGTSHVVSVRSLHWGGRRPECEGNMSSGNPGWVEPSPERSENVMDRGFESAPSLT